MDTILAHSRPNQQAIFESLIEPLSELLKESPGQNDFFRSIDLFQIEAHRQNAQLQLLSKRFAAGHFWYKFYLPTHRSKQPELPHVLFTLFVVYTSRCFPV